MIRVGNRFNMVRHGNTWRVYYVDGPVVELHLVGSKNTVVTTTIERLSDPAWWVKVKR